MQDLVYQFVVSLSTLSPLIILAIILCSWSELLRSDEGLTARNVSLRISLRWPIHIINPVVDKTKLSCNTSHWRCITVSSETYPLYIMLWNRYSNRNPSELFNGSPRHNLEIFRTNTNTVHKSIVLPYYMYYRFS